MTDTKICKACTSEKPLDAFEREKSCPDGYRGTCKACRYAKRKDAPEAGAQIETEESINVTQPDFLSDVLPAATEDEAPVTAWTPPVYEETPAEPAGDAADYFFGDGNAMPLPSGTALVSQEREESTILDFTNDPFMTPEEARSRNNSMKSNVNNWRRGLVEMHDRQGWRAMGFDSFEKYGEKEWGFQRAQCYNILKAARNEATIRANPEASKILDITLGGRGRKIPDSHLKALEEVPVDRVADVVLKAAEIAKAQEPPKGKAAEHFRADRVGAKHIAQAKQELLGISVPETPRPAPVRRSQPVSITPAPSILLPRDLEGEAEAEVDPFTEKAERAQAINIAHESLAVKAADLKSTEWLKDCLFIVSGVLLEDGTELLFETTISTPAFMAITKARPAL